MIVEFAKIKQRVIRTRRWEIFMDEVLAIKIIIDDRIYSKDIYANQYNIQNKLCYLNMGL